ncbi:MAG: tyrosine-type recombinase/integrase [Candidatus Devosia phytovorans]|uniref:Tyrosine-type recombinase/integrase n=1 Tax=Candidatus Devosia phytovorans TaxID=3121372 RepID=A0AAJ5VS62_9HYPH|nr:site-specific integrase [Devosia sp.]WEK03267.1 MAG: tyrosine-type recombinase/integrase [Devosia sp.]
MSVRKRTWLTKGVLHQGWQADYTDASGNRHRKQFKLKKDAEAFEKRAVTEVTDGTHIAESDGITVQEAGAHWIKAKIRSGREQATIAQYQQHLSLHIIPAIGHLKLHALTPVTLSGFEDFLIEGKRSPAMVKKIMVSLGSILANAQKRGNANRNVVRDMRGLGNGSDARAEKRAKARLRVGVDIPTPSEIRGILGALRDHWRPLFMTAIFTGLRASELRGLAWENVDLNRARIHVRQRADRYNSIGRPKSEAGERYVPIPRQLANVLSEWRLICPGKKSGNYSASGEPARVLDLVFPNGLGNVESLGNIINRGFGPTQVRAGIVVDTGKVDQDGIPIPGAKYSGMHALRHFHASWLINPAKSGGLGLSPKEVQERLGHSSIVITMNTYSHLFERLDDGNEMSEAAEALLQ